MQIKVRAPIKRGEAQEERKKISKSDAKRCILMHGGRATLNRTRVLRMGWWNDASFMHQKMVHVMHGDAQKGEGLGHPSARICKLSCSGISRQSLAKARQWLAIECACSRGEPMAFKY
jgi:hypothetical protein